MAITTEQLNKLPKFAKEEIEHLRRNLKTLTEDLATALGQCPKGDTKVRIDYQTEFYLPNHTRVVFEGRNKLNVSVHTHPEGHIYIEFGDGVIIPSARNVIHIVDNKNERGR